MKDGAKTHKKPNSMADLYAIKKSEVSATITQIYVELERHAKAAAADPDSSCYMIDITFMQARLSDALLTLIGTEPALKAACTLREDLRTRESQQEPAPEFAIGDKVHIKSECFSQEFDGIIAEQSYDGTGWNYRIDPIGDEEIIVAREANDEIWACDIEVTRC